MQEVVQQADGGDHKADHSGKRGRERATAQDEREDGGTDSGLYSHICPAQLENFFHYSQSNPCSPLHLGCRVFFFFFATTTWLILLAAYRRMTNSAIGIRCSGNNYSFSKTTNTIWPRKTRAPSGFLLFLPIYSTYASRVGENPSQ